MWKRQIRRFARRNLWHDVTAERSIRSRTTLERLSFQPKKVTKNSSGGVYIFVCFFAVDHCFCWGGVLFHGSMHLEYVSFGWFDFWCICWLFVQSYCNQKRAVSNGMLSSTRGWFFWLVVMERWNQHGWTIHMNQQGETSTNGPSVYRYIRFPEFETIWPDFVVVIIAGWWHGEMKKHIDFFEGKTTHFFYILASPRNVIWDLTSFQHFPENCSFFAGTALVAFCCQIPFFKGSPFIRHQTFAVLNGPQQKRFRHLNATQQTQGALWSVEEAGDAMNEISWTNAPVQKWDVGTSGAKRELLVRFQVFSVFFFSNKRMDMGLLALEKLILGSRFSTKNKDLIIGDSPLGRRNNKILQEKLMFLPAKTSSNEVFLKLAGNF